MKKRIFVSVHYMEIGGAETALVGLLNAFDSARVDVDLFICDHRGPMMQFIPEWINVLPPIPAYTMLERPFREVVSKGFWGVALSRLYGKIRSKIEYKRSGSTLPNVSSYGYTDSVIKHFMPVIDNTTLYDLAINFIGPNYIITDKVKARKTISWIHSDYTKQWVGNRTKKAVCPTTYIASISDDVTKTFLDVYPLYAPNIVQIENILSPAFVRERADMLDVELELMGGQLLENLDCGQVLQSEKH